MSSKGLVSICVILFSLIGSWIGAALDHGRWFGLASIVASLIGCFVGVWAAYLVDQYING